MSVKDITVWQWVALSVIVLAVVGEIVLVFTNPVAAIAAGVGYVLGCANLLLRKVAPTKSADTKTDAKAE